ncbi:hypothetical protein DBIPINDM_001414 [Mesorhizobium sp. AR02]|uniref:hypothetical protein n=1 Tax=Mesorhizobium sp. AR02 TaxID=2865837 RepID=UPI00215F4194|nr:hypothetical protein [Mesorhizobium sp. AR02]UVK54934.1 hypothetical protein DBIPINDM_001414 [Mesorhizobium sp. AR02]
MNYDRFGLVFPESNQAAIGANQDVDALGASALKDQQGGGKGLRSGSDGAGWCTSGFTVSLISLRN